MGRGGGKSPLLLPMLQRFLVSVLYRPLFNLTCGVISWQFSNFEALVIVHSCNLSPPRRLFEWGGPPNPPTPAPGVDVTSSNGGTPQTPPLPRQGWMLHLRSLLAMGAPKLMWNRADSGPRMGGGSPQTLLSEQMGPILSLEWGEDPPKHPSWQKGTKYALEWGDPPDAVFAI